jgi:hypothetical protein
MAVRTQIYQGLLWQQIIAERRLKAGARLPPLLLLVLYNGVKRWRAATDIRQLIALAPNSPLWSWQPQVRYYLQEPVGLRGAVARATPIEPFLAIVSRA